MGGVSPRVKLATKLFIQFGNHQVVFVFKKDWGMSSHGSGAGEVVKLVS